LIGNLPGGLSVDYSLIGSPKVVNNALEVSFNATLFSGETAYHTKNTSIIPHITGSEKQIVIFLNQYVVDSLLLSLQDLNRLNFYIAGDMLNNTSPISLNTASIGLFIPALSDTYGNDKTMDINCTSTKTPVLILNTNTSHVLFYPSCQFIVNVNETNKEVAFTVGLELNTQLFLYLEKGLLKGEIKSVGVQDLQVSQTAIGPIEGDKLKKFFNFAFSVGLPIINTMVFKNTGIELPSVAGLSFKDTDLSINQGYVEFDMNLLFDAPTKKRVLAIKYLR